MYKCIECSKEFETRFKHNAHMTCHSKKIKKTTLCIDCGKYISNNNYKKHIIYCNGKGPRHLREKYDDPAEWIRNKTYEEIYGDERSKEIKEKIRQSNLLKKDIILERQKEYWTEERRKLKSEEKKELYIKHPEKHPNRILASNRNNLSYPEKIIMNYFDEKNIQYKSQYRIENCYVDFLLNNNIVLEIDGEYWHKNVESDIKRQKMIESNGYKVFRIKAKNVLNNLKSLNIV